MQEKDKGFLIDFGIGIVLVGLLVQLFQSTAWTMGFEYQDYQLVSTMFTFIGFLCITIGWASIRYSSWKQAREQATLQ